MNMAADHQIEPKSRLFKVALGVIVLGVLALAALLVVRFWLFQTFSIPSSSMAPFLVPGDYIIVSKQSYRVGDPQRGEVAVFKASNNPTINFIMRVIGLPGDRVQIKGGRLYLNGVIVEREAVEFNLEGRGWFSGGKQPRFYRETFPNGSSSVIIEISDTDMFDNTEEFFVPEGHYFLMGDNRDNSDDSRMSIGYVPRANFVGSYAMHFWQGERLPRAK
jgi:signal peptidase I